MARANKGGWDFIKVGQVYQYKEHPLIAMVTIMEDNSTDTEYNFKVRIEKANLNAKLAGLTQFIVSFNKDFDGYYNHMSQFYEVEEYMVDYKWHRDVL